MGEGEREATSLGRIRRLGLNWRHEMSVWERGTGERPAPGCLETVQLAQGLVQRGVDLDVLLLGVL